MDALDGDRGGECLGREAAAEEDNDAVATTGTGSNVVMVVGWFRNGDTPVYALAVGEATTTDPVDDPVTAAIPGAATLGDKPAAERYKERGIGPLVAASETLAAAETWGVNLSSGELWGGNFWPTSDVDDCDGCDQGDLLTNTAGAGSDSMCNIGARRISCEERVG